MNVIIAGSRGVTDYEIVCEAIDRSGFHVTRVVSGAARGVDQLGERWAKEHDRPLLRMPAEWKTYGRSAGYRRNETMAGVADALIAIWDGQSPGTHHMIQAARRRGLRVFIYSASVALAASS
jgi:predicted Rossmann fold nucleotide-binding protein DprA/Smf involved in DNA uptake